MSERFSLNVYNFPSVAIMSEHEPPPTVAQEANAVTTLALADEKPFTTVPLEAQRISLERWERRAALHSSDSKARKALDEKCALLRQKYERDLDAWRGRKLQEPTKRLQASVKRKQTMQKRKDEAIDRIVAAVKRIATIKDGSALAAAVAAALEPEEAAPPAKKAKVVKKRVEEEDD